MDLFNLKEFTKGWFIGNFEPSIFSTSDFEIAVKNYSAGDEEDEHFHKIATEYTVIINGDVEMFNQKFSSGDIIKVNPGESTAFKALTNCQTVVIKSPSIKNDKYNIK